MKILQLDVDSLTFELIKKEAAVYEESTDKKVEVKDALALFVSVEEGDSEETAKQAMAAAIEFMKKQGRTRLVIYPFAHLSSNLAKPNDAIAVIKKMRELVPKEMELISAPFGWNKKLSLSGKGRIPWQSSPRATERKL